jgi:hypothetical protein
MSERSEALWLAEEKSLVVNGVGALFFVEYLTPSGL